MRNKSLPVAGLVNILDAACRATTVDEALSEVKSIMSLGHDLWAYGYMWKPYNNNESLYYGALLKDPVTLMPVVCTPTVGEACQKFGKLPMFRRGCYVSIADRANIRGVLGEYGAAELEKGPDGKPMCECTVFSDGGRILGLGDLGAWGMGIPIGKLDLYCVCAGVNPHRTIPLIIDAGCYDAEGNTANLTIRDSKEYTGLKRDRVVHRSKEGSIVNKSYHEDKSFIEEFMTAATEVFGKRVLLQFEDFNSNDAFPLLAWGAPGRLRRPLVGGFPGAGFIGVEWVTELQHFFLKLALTIIDVLPNCLGPLPARAANPCARYTTKHGIKQSSR